MSGRQPPSERGGIMRQRILTGLVRSDRPLCEPHARPAAGRSDQRGDNRQHGRDAMQLGPSDFDRKQQLATSWFYDIPKVPAAWLAMVGPGAIPNRRAL